MNMISFKFLLLFVAIFVLVGVYDFYTVPEIKNENKTQSTTQGGSRLPADTASTPYEDISPKEKSESSKLSEPKHGITTDQNPQPVSVDAFRPNTPTTTISLPIKPIVELPFVNPVQQPVGAFADINTKTREAMVNILCTSEYGGPFRPISGSGIVIDPAGVILTNAHVAQYILLKDYLFNDFMKCTARIGSPARATYAITPLYIPPHWIKKHAKQIDSTDPSGTGESDYALLLIIGRTDSSLVLKTPLPFLKVQTNSDMAIVGNQVLIAGYPAGFLGGIVTQKDLYLTSTITTIMQKFTFDQDKNTTDLISLGGSVVAQKGSSGGAVVNTDGELVALVVTSTDAETTSNRDLRATTLGHINRDLTSYNGTSLSSLLSGDLKSKADIFNNTIAPTLTDLLVKAIND